MMMEEEMFKSMEGRRVFIETHSSRRYTGTIEKVESGFIKLLDKFKSIVFISINEVNIIQEDSR